jgi:hypothetical protein
MHARAADVCVFADKFSRTLHHAPVQSLFKRFGQQSSSSQESRLSVESGKYVFHYILDSGVAFLTLTEKGCVSPG